MKTIEETMNAADLLELSGLFQKWNEKSGNDEIKKATEIFARIVKYQFSLTAKVEYLEQALSDFQYELNKKIMKAMENEKSKET